MKDWTLVKANCLPSSAELANIDDDCQAQMFHTSSIYHFNSATTNWQRIAIPLSTTGPSSSK